MPSQSGRPAAAVRRVSGSLVRLRAEWSLRRIAPTRLTTETRMSNAESVAYERPAAGQYSFAEKRRRVFAIMAASSGNLVEWFDFYTYAFCAIYFAPVFFPKGDQTAQLLNAAGVFAAG